MNLAYSVLDYIDNIDTIEACISDVIRPVPSFDQREVKRTEISHKFANKTRIFVTHLEISSDIIEIKENDFMLSYQSLSFRDVVKTACNREIIEKLSVYIF